MNRGQLRMYHDVVHILPDNYDTTNKYTNDFTQELQQLSINTIEPLPSHLQHKIDNDIENLSDTEQQQLQQHTVNNT